MLKVLMFFVLILCISSVTCWGGLMLGPGRWLCLNVMNCENPEQYEIPYSIIRKKINRTHDCFSMSIDVDRELNFTYGIEIEAYQKLDGGFKYFETVSSDCACKFIKKYAQENMERFLTLAGYETPDCPLKTLSFDMKNFVMDYRELPQNGVYGTFKVIPYLLYKGKRVGCAELLLNFDHRDDDDEDDDLE